MKLKPILMLAGGGVLIALIFLLRNADDKIVAETTISKGQEKYKQGDYHGAIKLFEDAIDLDASNYKAYFSRAMCYAEMNQQKDALKDYTMSIKLSPENDRATLYYLRGESYFRLKDRTKGCEDMKMALSLGKSDAQAMIQMYCE
jgi:stress-induced-phosphoprotein 1